VSSSEWTEKRLRAIGDFWADKLVLESVALGVYERLADGPRDRGDLADELGLDPRACRLFLDALVAIGLLEKAGDRYGNSAAAARWLTRGSPDHLADVLAAADDTWALWGRLRDALRTGRPQREGFVFDEPEAARTLLNAIDRRARPHVRALLEQGMIDPSRYRRMLDLGGGAGTYSIAFCEANPELRATLTDLPPAIALARERTVESGLEGRIDLIELDFEAGEIPGTYDLVWVSNIVHGRGPDANRRLVRRLRDVLEPGGDLVIHDIVMDEDRVRPGRGAVFSVHMLLNNGVGRCYTLDEIRGWMADAGLRDIRRVRDHDDHELVFGTR
jgi:SAM-dependent methyltransferase